MTKQDTDPRAGMLATYAETTLGVKVQDVSFPAGRYRPVVRLHLTDGETLIAALRDDPHRALLEERVLSALRPLGAPVPKVFSFNGLVTLQSDEGMDRLSDTALVQANTESETDLIERALVALNQVHICAAEAGLNAYVPILGAYEYWIRQLIDRPALIGNHLGVRAPVPDIEGIFHTLTLVNPVFVKWDARPANAVINARNKISWIDWEHCGARNALDDFVKVVCDENISIDEQRDDVLVAKYANVFGSEHPIANREDYARVAGTMHFCVRLALALNRHEEDVKFDAIALAAKDRVGSTKGQIFNLCWRAADWSSKSKKTETLSPWFRDIANRFEEAKAA